MVSDVQIKAGDIQPSVLCRSQILFEGIVPSVRRHILRVTIN